MQNKLFTAWFNIYQEQALSFRERRIIVLLGANYWASEILNTIDINACNGAKNIENVWYIYGESENIKSTVSEQHFRDKLGSESNFVVIQNINSSIDAFAALSGTLIAGGILFLLVNDEEQIESSCFNQRFFKLLTSFSDHVVLKQKKFLLPEINDKLVKKINSNSNQLLPYRCKTDEQLMAVNAIIKVFKGKRNRPLVLTADRGRGKTSALAIACGQLLQEATKKNVLTIVITAVNIRSLNVFFKQLQICSPNGELSKGHFTVKYGKVIFRPIDQLLVNKEKASLLLIDEAASFPIYLLQQVLLHFSRVVFSSTVHGYEGAGRGFTLNFQRTLSDKYNNLKKLHIHEPIRWAKNDPLERLVFESCLLNSELPIVNADVIQPSKLIFKTFDSFQLSHDETLLKQVFSILVTAHYQTKPNDVRMLLDNKKVTLVCLLSKQNIALQIENSEYQIVAVALLINEGCGNTNAIPKDEITAVSQSKKRLKDNFIPQSLLTQCGIEDAFNFKYVRVMRIAVHPNLQKQGIGHFFMERITDYSINQDADMLASSFGATKNLLSFWLTNNFKIARIGFKKDKASGEQSALVIKPLSQKSYATVTKLNLEFYRSFDYLLADEYKYLTTKLVALILQYCPEAFSAELSVHDKANVVAFSQGNRQFSDCVYSLHLWLKLQLANASANAHDEYLVLISRIFQKNSINDVCSTFGFTGKKELENFLKSNVIRLLAD